MPINTIFVEFFILALYIQIIVNLYFITNATEGKIVKMQAKHKTKINNKKQAKNCKSILKKLYRFG